MRKIMIFLALLLLFIPLSQAVTLENGVYIVTNEDSLIPINSQTFLSQNPEPSIFSFGQYTLWLNYLAALKEIELPPKSVSGTFESTGCAQSDLLTSGITSFSWSGDSPQNVATYTNNAQDRYAKLYSMRAKEGVSIQYYETLTGPIVLDRLGGKGNNQFSQRCTAGYICRFLVAEWGPCKITAVPVTPVTPSITPTTTAPTTQYIKQYQKRCVGSALYWYDSNGNPTDYLQLCDFGCEDAACKPSHAETIPITGEATATPSEAPAEKEVNISLLTIIGLALVIIFLIRRRSK